MLEELIIDCLRTHYGIEVDTLTFLPLGADMNASVYKAQTHGRESYFVKVKRGHQPDIGVEIVELLHDAGIAEVIPPIKTIHGKVSQRIDNFTLILYPFVEGEDGFSRVLTNAQWRTLGKALRQVHDLQVPPSVQHHIRREAYSPKWREAVRSLLPLLEARPAGDPIALKLANFMKENISAIQQLVERAEELGKRLQSGSPKFVLCHSDIHAGNVLLSKKDALYMVDWDHPIMAPKERDLMFIGGGVANVWNRPDEVKLFYEGYGKTEIDPTILTYYRHERIVEDIAEYGQALLLTTTRGKDRQEMYTQFLDMFVPNGVVDIAFKTAL